MLFPLLRRKSFADGATDALFPLEKRERTSVSNGGEHVRGRKKQKYALHKLVRSLPDAFSRKRSVFLQKR